MKKECVAKGQLEDQKIVNSAKEGFIQMLMRSLTNHRELYHNNGMPDCVICRSLRRNILRGLK